MYFFGGLIGAPLFWANVTLDEQGIHQHVYKRHFVRWADIVSWERTADRSSGGPETITISTRTESLALNHNCVYGKRLDEIEAELRNRAPAGTGSHCITSRSGDE